MKSYKLVLEDTSPSEMDRFREWMFQILLETKERKKNLAEMEKQVLATQKPKTIPVAKAKVNKTVDEVIKPKITLIPTMPTHKGVNKIYHRGFIVATSGIRLHATPSTDDLKYKAKNGRYATVYKFLSLVTVVHEELDNLGWYKIRTEDAQYGYIEKRYIEIVPIDKKLDNYTRTFLYVKPGYIFEKNVANYFYANYQHKTGDDRRTLAEAFYLLNQQSKHRHGVVLRERDTSTIDKLDLAAKAFTDPNFQKARALYDQLQLTSGCLVRIPTNEHIALQKKKGKLSQRSAAENFIIEMARYYQGFQEGLLAAIFDEIKGIFVGLWDLLKGIFTGSLFQQLWELGKSAWEKGAWEGFLKPMIDALGKNWNTFWKKFNSGNPRLRAFLIGDIIGRIIFNIVIAILTAGATIALAATTKGAALLAKFSKIASIVRKTVNTIPKKQRDLIIKKLKERKGVAPKKPVIKKTKQNPAQHSEFIDTDRNIPGSKKPTAKKPTVKNTVIGKNINHLKRAPNGYRIVTANGKKQIKRVDANNPKTPRLEVDNNGKITEYKGLKSNRISNSKKFRNVLKTPKGHQAHHLVADNVVRNSKLFGLARKKTGYDLDRKGNGVNLAKTTEDFVHDKSGMSKKLPLHNGPHKDWDKLTERLIERYEKQLIKNFKKLDCPPIPTKTLEAVTVKIEQELLKELHKLPAGVKLN